MEVNTKIFANDTHHSNTLVSLRFEKDYWFISDEERMFDSILSMGREFRCLLNSSLPKIKIPFLISTKCENMDNQWQLN